MHQLQLQKWDTPKTTLGSKDLRHNINFYGESTVALQREVVGGRKYP